MSEQPPNLSVEAQLAVLHTKVDQLIALNQTRGEDHEHRLRSLESTSITKKAAYTLVTLVCMLTAAGTNILAFWLK